MYTNDIFKMMILYSVLLLIVNITYLYMFQHSRLVICNKKKIPMQSIVRAFGSVHPCIQDPLNASQCWFLHLVGQKFLQPGEYLFGLQPTNVNNNNFFPSKIFFFNFCNINS